MEKIYSQGYNITGVQKLYLFVYSRYIGIDNIAL